MIAPDWLLKEDPQAPRVLEGLFTASQIAYRNKQGYNVYWLPNHPIEYAGDETINGTHVDKFDYVFVDFDLKDKAYTSKEAFVEHVISECPAPTTIIDSGNGVHAYWKVSDLDAISYLRLSRRFMRLLKTDEAVGQLFQLMRLPETWNTKSKENKHWCFKLHDSDAEYSCEELDKFLPAIALDDEKYCQTHYDQTYNIATLDLTIDYKLPPKFGKLLIKNGEVREIWSGDSDDRSRDDYRLGNLMLADKFTKEEAMSVLVNSSKALSRAPVHRLNYARNIIEKIWTFEENKDNPAFSSVRDILMRPVKGPKGQRITCWKFIDGTKHGFRLGHVLGLVAGSGVGKTAMALNIFLGFAASNPDMNHLFCPLEETDIDIAERWKTMCGENTNLHGKVHILSNYDEEGKFKDLSLENIKDCVLDFQKTTGKKIGCVVIDHIGVLCNDNKLGQDEGVKKIAKAMKGFAEETQTFLIMQSQTSRSKAGIGDKELDKDAAFGTSVFENFCDFLVTLWQPLKRVYETGAPTIMAYKFCKIRHKNQKEDSIKEDKRYLVFFDPDTQLIRELVQSDGDLKYWMAQANAAKKVSDADISEYTSMVWPSDKGSSNEPNESTTNSNK